MRDSLKNCFCFKNFENNKEGTITDLVQHSSWKQAFLLNQVTPEIKLEPRLKIVLEKCEDQKSLEEEKEEIELQEEVCSIDKRHRKGSYEIREEKDSSQKESNYFNFSQKAEEAAKELTNSKKDGDEYRKSPSNQLEVMSPSLMIRYIGSNCSNGAESRNQSNSRPASLYSKEENRESQSDIGSGRSDVKIVSALAPERNEILMKSPNLYSSQQRIKRAQKACNETKTFSNNRFLSIGIMTPKNGLEKTSTIPVSPESPRLIKSRETKRTSLTTKKNGQETTHHMSALRINSPNTLKVIESSNEFLEDEENEKEMSLTLKKMMSSPIDRGAAKH